MFDNILKKKPIEPKVETCISCNTLIHDNPHYEIFFKDIIEGTVFSFHIHNSPDHPDCYTEFSLNIRRKIKNAEYLRTGITYTFDKSMKKKKKD